MLKPSQASLVEPFLHLVGDRRGRADEGEPAIAAEALRELADGQVFASRQFDDALARRSCWHWSRGFRGSGPSGSKPEASWPSAIDSEAMALS